MIFLGQRLQAVGKGTTMSDRCFELNPRCMARAEGAAQRPCPAYEQKIACHKLDWKPMYEHLPAGHRLQMIDWMKIHCPVCPVYSMHRTIIDAKIAAMQ
jgi:hypothetical protein